MVDIDLLIGGIVALVIGVILYVVKNYLPPVAEKFAAVGGIILAIIGVVLIVLSVILPLVY